MENPVFTSLPHEKQERIIKAAMKEFTAGYKKASTDNIVKAAGISKGILFHYFGTKEKLHNYLIDYAIHIVQEEFLNLFTPVQKDILESVWQLSLLKRDLSLHFPDIFDFIAAAYMDKTIVNETVTNNLQKFWSKQAQFQASVYQNVDTSLFKEEVDPTTAIKIITWTLDGFGQSKTHLAQGENVGETLRDSYGLFLEELQEILDTLRRCFYK